MRSLTCLLFLSVFYLSCSGGSSSNDSQSVEIGTPQLEAMLTSITKASFGAEYLDMVPSVQGSGVETVEEIIEDADAPEDERMDARTFGLVSGFATTYFQTDAVFNRQGPFIISARVMLFKSETGASGYLKDFLDDGRRDLSGTVEVGTLKGFEVFDVDAGEEAWGAFVTMRADGEYFNTATDFDASTTIVSLQRDRILATVIAFRADTKNVATDVLPVLREIDANIERVLRGEAVPATPAASGVEVEAEELLRASRERLALLESYRLVQRHSTVGGGGVSFTSDSDLRFKKPDLAFGSSSGRNLAIVGLDAFVETETGAWQCFEDVTGFSLQEIGFNPPDISAQLDIIPILTSAQVLADKTIDGYQVKHVRAVLDPEEYLGYSRDLLGAEGFLGSVLDSLHVSSVSLEFFIDAEMLTRRIVSDVRMTLDGRVSEIRVEATLSEFDRDFEFPLTEPYPACGGLRS